jgi:hypothetical protein
MRLTPKIFAHMAKFGPIWSHCILTTNNFNPLRINFVDKLIARLQLWSCQIITSDGINCCSIEHGSFVFAFVYCLCRTRMYVYLYLYFCISAIMKVRNCKYVHTYVCRRLCTYYIAFPIAVNLYHRIKFWDTEGSFFKGGIGKNFEPRQILFLGANFR